MIEAHGDTVAEAMPNLKKNSFVEIESDYTSKRNILLRINLKLEAEVHTKKNVKESKKKNRDTAVTKTDRNPCLVGDNK